MHESTVSGVRNTAVGTIGRYPEEDFCYSRGEVMRTLASRILYYGGNRQIRTDYRNPVEEKGLHGRSLSQREGPQDPHLDRLLLFF